MYRERLMWTPRWEDSVYQSYAASFVRKVAWRTPHMEVDDLMSHAWLAFHECTERYPHVGAPQHFMSLFKRVLYSRMMSLVAEGMRKRWASERGSGGDPDDDQPRGLEIPVQDSAEKVEWGILLSESPPEVQEILRKLVVGTLELKCRRREDGSRETTSEMLARMAGVSDWAGFRQRLKETLDGRRTAPHAAG